MEHFFSFSVFFYVSEWIIRIVMLFEVPRRRHPQTAMAWLMVIFFEPWLGLALYHLFGNNHLPRRRIAQHTELMKRIKTLDRRFTENPNVVKPDLGQQAKEAVHLAERLGYMPILGGNQVALIAETEAAVERLIHDIDAAQKHVNLLFYIFADDGTGKKVVAALDRAVRRGVECRVLVDGVGSRPFLKRLFPLMMAAKVDMRIALPVGLFRRRMARIDLRNHRKIAVIDGLVAYTGSQNIVDAGYGHKDLAWYDLMLRLTGPIVTELQAVFATDWYFETNEMLDATHYFPAENSDGDVAVQALPSGPSYPTENYQRMVVAAIHAAEKSVTITTPYFIPDEAFLQAMETAVLRGVEVTLIVPRRSDQKLVGAAARSYFDDVLEMGVKLFLYDKGLLHAKTMAIDDSIAFIGSSNFDIRSFALNFEINLLFYGPEVAQMLRDQQSLYLKDSFELTPERWAERPTAKKLCQNVARLVSPLL